MELRLFGQKKDPEEQRQYDERDAMKGKFDLEDLKQRKGQHLINSLPSTLPKVNGNTTTTPQEEQIDTALRQLSVVTNGQGALGKDFPITAENRVAYERMTTITRWATNNLKPTNKLRLFMEGQFNDKFHTTFDRALERDEPVVVITYKPMLNPAPTTVQAPPDQDRENARKKP